MKIPSKLTKCAFLLKPSIVWFLGHPKYKDKCSGWSIWKGGTLYSGVQYVALWVPCWLLCSHNTLWREYGNFSLVPSLHVCFTLRPCEHVATSLLHAFHQDLADMLTKKKGWTILILKVKITMDRYGNKGNLIETFECILIKVFEHFDQYKRVNET